MNEVTVVVPTRNRSAILRQTLQSITNQRDVSFSVIVVDDASSDETAEMVKQMPEVNLVQQRQQTEQAVARNTGACEASTPWIAFCDDDDLWAPTKLRRQLDAAAHSGADWCTASSVFVDEDLNPIGGARLSNPRTVTRKITTRNLIPSGGSGVLVRRALFESVGGFRKEARFVEDWDLWIRLSRHGTVACVDELLVAARQWPRSFSHASFDIQYAAFYALTNENKSTGRKRIPRPRTASTFEVRQRLRKESRLAIAKDLPRLLYRTPTDTVPVLLMLALPDRLLTELRLIRLGLKDLKQVDSWLAPYRDKYSAD